MDATESFAQAPAGAPQATVERSRTRRVRARPPKPVLAPWLQGAVDQPHPARRCVASLPARGIRRRARRRRSEGHIQAVNALMGALRRGLIKMSGRVTKAASAALGGAEHRTAFGDDAPKGPRPPLGAGHRADLGFLFRAVRPAAGRLRGLVVELRPHRARLLSGGLHRNRQGQADPRAAAVLLHAHRLRARHVPPRHPLAPSRDGN